MITYNKIFCTNVFRKKYQKQKKIHFRDEKLFLVDKLINYIQRFAMLLWKARNKQLNILYVHQIQPNQWMQRREKHRHQT